MSHSSLSDEIDPKGLQAAGEEEGVYLDDLADGAVLEVETRHHRYKLVKNSQARAFISGHPKYCPEPVTVQIDGSGGGGRELKPGYIGRGMHLVFEHPVYHTITTSRILDIRRVA